MAVKIRPSEELPHKNYKAKPFTEEVNNCIHIGN